MNCPYCGFDPFDYVDVGIGRMPVAVTCCEYGIMMFQDGMSKEEIDLIIDWQSKFVSVSHNDEESYPVTDDVVPF